MSSGMSDDQILGGAEGSASDNETTADDLARKAKAERAETVYDEVDETSTRTRTGAIPSGYGSAGGMTDLERGAGR